eukprot:TRINITY_DN29376_c0_g1_i1.p1 TRINITY_DN29376_c0_g1~~TRINITY_DN29376_c0_g1_i1.p1  ORF type:complete len:814 (+),score=174.05 TRINITY_DN29376_c0_g1_i1:79-2442(+)
MPAAGGAETVTCCDAVGEFLWCGHRDGGVSVRVPKTNTVVDCRWWRRRGEGGPFKGPPPHPTAMAALPGDTEVWVGYSDGRLLAVCAETREVRGGVNAHVGRINRILPHRDWTFTASDDTKVHRYARGDQGDPRPKRVFTCGQSGGGEHTMPVVALSAHSDVLLSAALDQTAKVWSCLSGACIVTLALGFGVRPAADGGVPALEEVDLRLEELTQQVAALRLRDGSQRFAHLLPEALHVTPPARRPALPRSTAGSPTAAGGGAKRRSAPVQRAARPEPASGPTPPAGGTPRISPPAPTTTTARASTSPHWQPVLSPHRPAPPRAGTSPPRPPAHPELARTPQRQRRKAPTPRQRRCVRRAAAAPAAAHMPLCAAPVMRAPAPAPAAAAVAAAAAAAERYRAAASPSAHTGPAASKRPAGISPPRAPAGPCAYELRLSVPPGASAPREEISVCFSPSGERVALGAPPRRGGAPRAAARAWSLQLRTELRLLRRAWGRLAAPVERRLPENARVARLMQGISHAALLSRCWAHLAAAAAARRNRASAGAGAPRAVSGTEPSPPRPRITAAAPPRGCIGAPAPPTVVELRLPPPTGPAPVLTLLVSSRVLLAGIDRGGDAPQPRAGLGGLLAALAALQVEVVLWDDGADGAGEEQFAVLRRADERTQVCGLLAARRGPAAGRELRVLARESDRLLFVEEDPSELSPSTAPAAVCVERAEGAGDTGTLAALGEVVGELAAAAGRGPRAAVPVAAALPRCELLRRREAMAPGGGYVWLYSLPPVAATGPPVPP